jgi:hypothetical protein
VPERLGVKLWLRVCVPLAVRAAVAVDVPLPVCVGDGVAACDALGVGAWELVRLGVRDDEGVTVVLAVASWLEVVLCVAVTTCEPVEVEVCVGVDVGTWLPVRLPVPLPVTDCVTDTDCVGVLVPDLLGVCVRENDCV